ncbi:MAG TPA: DUF4097 family beta strand repeat-containing protein [Motilibacteraceae bacterium]|nr:DUF4097 family beta strand repeat-containing protein [Motilibacteraceae bacterium]
MESGGTAEDTPAVPAPRAPVRGGRRASRRGGAARPVPATARPRLRRFALAVGLALLLLAVVVPLSLSRWATRAEAVTSTWAQVATVVVDVGSGDVIVRGEERSDVRVVTTTTASLRHPDTSTGRRSDQLLVSARCPSGPALLGLGSCRTDVSVEVPHGTRVEVRSDRGAVQVQGVDAALRLRVGEGQVKVETATGPLDVSVDRGPVTATDLAGPSVDVRAGQGNVRVQAASPVPRLTARSSAGTVDVSVPAGRTYAVDASTGAGVVDTGGVLTDPESSSHVTARSEAGDVTVSTTPQVR